MNSLTEFLILMRTELMLVGIIFWLLILKIGGWRIAPQRLLLVVNGLLILTLLLGFFVQAGGQLFGSMFRTDPLLALEKNMLVLATLLISMHADAWLKTHRHLAEFFMLLLSTLLGMCFMLSAANLLMFYLGLELSTIPLAALANFDLHRKRSAEAAFKMIISAAFASGLLLFGISWMYGATGTLDFSALSAGLSNNPMSLLAFVFLMAGFGFKISAVPFHLWTADVYEGAPMPVTAYLSVVSKAAVLMVMGAVLYSVFRIYNTAWYNLLYFLSVATMITGNLFALRQQQMKRFLAFSSIAQVGFILVGLSGQNGAGAASLLFFILVYIFSNLGAFGVVGLVSASTGLENIDDYKGFHRTNPALAWVLALSLFSLAGIPPTAGFFGKFFLLLAGAARGNWVLITIAALNMMISLYYYLRVIRAMFMDSGPAPVASRLEVPLMPKLSLGICVAGILVTGIYSGAYDYILRFLQ